MASMTSMPAPPSVTSGIGLSPPHAMGGPSQMMTSHHTMIPQAI
jgi:hypothetical protein